MRLALHVTPHEYRDWLLTAASRSSDAVVGERGSANSYSPLDIWLQQSLEFDCGLRRKQLDPEHLHLCLWDSDDGFEVRVDVPAWLETLYFFYAGMSRQRKRKQCNPNEVTAQCALSDLEQFVQFSTRKRKKDALPAA